MGNGKREAREQGASARHGRLRRSSAWRNALRALLTAAIVVVLSGGAVAAYAAWGLWNSAKTVDLPDGGDDPSALGAGSQAMDGALTIALFGSDSRVGQSLDDGETGELNDVNLLLHVSADHQNATVISFPRDLMVPIPSCPDGQGGSTPAMSEQQLNTALSYGGLSCAVLTLEQLTGMDIPYGGVVTFDGVIGVSNALGGVDVCLAEPIDDSAYTGLVLPAGNNTLIGLDALQFLRTRHGVGDGGDTSRISNQQIFMSSLVRQLRSAETLSNPVKVYALAKAGLENVTLSSNMKSIGFMQQLAGTVKDIDLERINFVQYPSFSHPYQPGRLTPDTASAQILMDAVMSGQAFQVSGVGEGVEVEGADPATPPVDAGAEQTNPDGTPVEGGDGTTPPATGSPIVLPDNITGQSAAVQTCSRGRTVF